MVSAYFALSIFFDIISSGPESYLISKRTISMSPKYSGSSHMQASQAILRKNIVWPTITSDKNDTGKRAQQNIPLAVIPVTYTYQ